jgi:hypothetical protein
MPLSGADIEGLLSREGGEAVIYLLTLTGADLPGGVERIARNSEDVTSNGNLFKAGWFDVTLPEESDQQPLVRLTVPNVNRLVGLALIETTESLTVKVEAVWPSNWNAVFYAVDFLKLRFVTIDPLVVEGTLSVAQLDTEPYGAVRLVPAHFPWMNYA